MKSMLYIVNEITGTVYWQDCYFGWESMDKAQMYLDSTDLYKQSQKRIGNDIYIFVKTKSQL